ncbi:MAG: OB-fold domain-containing protein [Reyranellaceae bacterium]
MNAPVKSPQAAQSDLEGIFFVEATWEMEQLYRPDPWLAKSLAEFRNKRICGGLVRDTGRVIFPPASFCEISFRPVTALVPVGPGGIVRSYTVSRTKFANGLAPPYVIVFVQFDGASTASPGYLRNCGNVDDLSLDVIGARCRAIFAEAPVGDWTDFWFELER